MDTYLAAVRSHLKLSRMMLQERLKVVEKSPVGLIRRQARIEHSRAMLSLIEEVEGIVMQDPDMWDEEPGLVPF